jgi:hypothetical protein
MYAAARGADPLVVQLPLLGIVQRCEVADRAS